MRNFLYIFTIILLLASLQACAHKQKQTQPVVKEDQSIQDLKDFPQNLEVYAKLAGENKILIDRETQENLYRSFKNIFFGPWEMSRTTIRLHEVSPLFSRARGYKDASRVWTQDEWNVMRANANLSSFPSRGQSAITLKSTDLRELPTNEYRFSEPVSDASKNPFDYFQYSLLPAATPVFVAHTTLDGRWHYVECPITGGWVEAKNIAFVDDEFKREWRRGVYAAIIRDNVALPDKKTAIIGTVLPVISHARNFNLLIPVAAQNGFAKTKEIQLTAKDAAIMPMPLTPGNVAKVGNSMMGQQYGWGGMLGRRDCSSMIRDLFTPFGLWLPRNSAVQAKRGAIIPLSGLSASEKNQLIIARGDPFISLLGMKGHITLYIGQYKGKAAIFHNVWGIRVVENDNDNERFVIGRAVVTSITPGMELKNLYLPVTFVDRLRTLTRLGIR